MTSTLSEQHDYLIGIENERANEKENVNNSGRGDSS
jgi:hypothetical protein